MIPAMTYDDTNGDRMRWDETLRQWVPVTGSLSPAELANEINPILSSRFLSITDAATTYAPITGSTVYSTMLKATAGEYWSSHGVNDSTGVAMSVGLIHYTPIYVPGAVDRLVCEVTVAGGASTKIRLGLYTRTAGGRPGNKLTELSADLDASTTGAKEGAVTYSGSAGWLFVALVTDAASISVRTHQGQVLGSPAGFSAANALNNPGGAWIETKSGLTLPATATVSGVENNSPKVAVRVA